MFVCRKLVHLYESSANFSLSAHTCVAYVPSPLNHNTCILPFCSIYKLKEQVHFKWNIMAVKIVNAFQSIGKKAMKKG